MRWGKLARALGDLAIGGGLSLAVVYLLKWGTGL